MMKVFDTISFVRALGTKGKTKGDMTKTVNKHVKCCQHFSPEKDPPSYMQAAPSVDRPDLAADSRPNAQAGAEPYCVIAREESFKIENLHSDHREVRLSTRSRSVSLSVDVTPWCISAALWVSGARRGGY